VSWLKQPGDKVKKGESIVVVESDKADMDVESFSEGILGAIVIPEGGVATVGAAIAYIAESEADLAAAKEKAGAAFARPIWRRQGAWEIVQRAGRQQ
jgi:pyruvate dehydrogenase E2 component (dihydrolipoamide acetyltransferase)